MKGLYSASYLTHDTWSSQRKICVQPVLSLYTDLNTAIEDIERIRGIYEVICAWIHDVHTKDSDVSTQLPVWFKCYVDAKGKFTEEPKVVS